MTEIYWNLTVTATMQYKLAIRSWHLFLLTVVLFTACSNRQRSVVHADDPIDLRVMSFNIEWGGTNVSFDNVVEAINLSAADIVGIQEAEGNLERLANELGWYYNARNYAISRYPLIEPQDADGKYVYVEVSPSKVVALANVHLPSDPAGPHEIRDGAELAEILELERTTRLPALQPYLDVLPGLAERGIPVFMTGDFNAPSHQDWTEAAVGTRAFLRYAVDWPVSRAASNAGFRDSWREAHVDPVADPGLTWWAARPPLESYAPGDVDPQDRIDFVWYAGPAEVSDSVIVGETGRPDVSISVMPWPSDHRAVLSTFVVQPAEMPTLLSTGKWVYRSGEAVEIFSRGLAEATVTVLMRDAAGTSTDVAKLNIASGATKILPPGTLDPARYLISTDANGTILQREFWVIDDSTAPTIAVLGSKFKVDQAIPVSWNNGPGNRNDYIAVYPPGSPAQYDEGDYQTGLPWAYIGSLPEGLSQMDAENAGWGWPIPPGTYVMRLMEDDGYDILAESASFEVH